MTQEKQQLKFERICENCDTDDGRRTNFDFMSSANIFKQSVWQGKQELKLKEVGAFQR